MWYKFSDKQPKKLGRYLLYGVLTKKGYDPENLGASLTTQDYKIVIGEWYKLDMPKDHYNRLNNDTTSFAEIGFSNPDFFEFMQRPRWHVPCGFEVLFWKRLPRAPKFNDETL